MSCFTWLIPNGDNNRKYLAFLSQILQFQNSFYFLVNRQLYQPKAQIQWQLLIVSSIVILNFFFSLLSFGPKNRVRRSFLRELQLCYCISPSDAFCRLYCLQNQPQFFFYHIISIQFYVLLIYLIFYNKPEFYAKAFERITYSDHSNWAYYSFRYFRNHSFALSFRVGLFYLLWLQIFYSKKKPLNTSLKVILKLSKWLLLMKK